MATELLAPQLPVTGSFAAPLGLYYIFLNGRTVYHRINESRVNDQPSTAQGDAHDLLYASQRAQINFSENVPLALTLAAIVELNGGSKKVLAGVLGGLTVARILHAEFGMMAKNYVGIGRPIGYWGFTAILTGLAGWSGYLVKAYWGY